VTAVAARPLVVGLEGRLSVLVEGTVTAVGDSTVEIAGWTLPTRLGDGVRTVSLVDAVTGSLAECDRDHCDSSDCGCEPDCIEEHCDHCYEGTDMPEILRVVERVHDDGHTGPFRHCPDPVCAVVQEVAP
jgi:hypothetical protein